MSKRTKGLTVEAGGIFGGTCPIDGCGEPTRVTWDGGALGFPVVLYGCEHLVRAWIVARDQRRRAEYDTAGGRAWPRVDAGEAQHASH